MDLSSFYQELDNDKDTIITILELFISEYENVPNYYNECFNNKKWQDIHIASHSLKGILEGFGEKKFTLFLNEIEIKTSKNKSITENDLKYIIENLSIILIEISVEIDKLKEIE